MRLNRLFEKTDSEKSSLTIGGGLSANGQAHARHYPSEVEIDFPDWAGTDDEKAQEVEIDFPDWAGTDDEKAQQEQPQPTSKQRDEQPEQHEPYSEPPPDELAKFSLAFRCGACGAFYANSGRCTECGVYKDRETWEYSRGDNMGRGKGWKPKENKNMKAYGQWLGGQNKSERFDPSQNF